jgi:hypothetical protein
LYDSDPHLVDSELDQYLNVSADDIKNVAARYMDARNRVVLDIIPAPAAEHAAAAEAAEVSVAAAPQSPGEPQQPAAPAPQVPEKPAAEPESPVPSASVQSNDPADVPPQTKPGSGPLHP